MRAPSYLEGRLRQFVRISYSKALVSFQLRVLLAVRIVVVRLSSCSCLRKMKGTGVCISEIPPPSLQRLQEVRALEVFGHIVVQASDDFVDGLLPGLLGVFSSHQGLEELAKGLFYDVSESFWSLQRRTKTRVTK